MFIDLNLIRSVFMDYDTTLDTYDSNFCLCCFARLHPSQTVFSPYTLYLTDSTEEITSRTDFPIQYLLCLPEKNDTPDVVIRQDNMFFLIVYGCSLQDAEQKLSCFFEHHCGKALMSDTLLDILFSESGIQNMVDKIYYVFQNPITVFDAGYNLIAANFDQIESFPMAMSIIENNGFTDNEFEMINHLNNIHKRMMTSDVPLLIHHPEVGFDQLVCPINSSHNYGHIVLTALNHPFNEYDKDFLRILQKAIDQQMKKDEFIRNNRGYHYEYFLKDLLDGKVIQASSGNHSYDYINEDLSELLYCMTIETARSASTLSTLHIRSDIENLFPKAKTLLYNGEIIAVINKEDSAPILPEELNELQNICSEHGLYAGLSNSFSDISSLKEYYKQALRALELGVSHDPSPQLFIYDSYYLRHLSHIFSQKESLQTFCHPIIQKLLDFDTAHESDLTETLYNYLVYERNLAAAAKAMFIHRNTLVYRMKKIDQMVSIDYNNPAERQYMILSYELYKAIIDN